MDERPKKRRGPLTWLVGRRRRFWAVVFALPFLWVGSLGPAFWFYFNVRLPWVCAASIELLYLPINAITVRFEPARAVEDWYLGLWVDRSVWPVNAEIPPENGPLILPVEESEESG